MTLFFIKKKKIHEPNIWGKKSIKQMLIIRVNLARALINIRLVGHEKATLL